MTDLRVHCDDGHESALVAVHADEQWDRIVLRCPQCPRKLVASKANWDGFVSQLLRSGLTDVALALVEKYLAAAKRAQ